MIEGRVKDLQKMIETGISEHTFGDKPASLYEPIQYIMSLGGKRIRPLLVLISHELFDKNAERIINQALAVEVFHNFTLMHDDIMDKAPLRRGKSTVHEKWGENTAILSGDVMLVKAYELFMHSNEEMLVPVLNAFNRCATEVCEGQQLDMEFEDRSTVSEAEYLRMIRLKTAVLLGFSTRLGAMLAEAKEESCQLLQEFATNTGVGFQLMDDLLDVYGEAEKFGKQKGGDIIANKKTFLLIEALEKGSSEEKKVLKYWLEQNEFDPDEKVREVMGIYDKIGIPDITRKKMDEYFDLGLKKLDELSVPEENKLSMRAFMNALTMRDH